MAGATATQVTVTVNVGAADINPLGLIGTMKASFDDGTETVLFDRNPSNRPRVFVGESFALDTNTVSVPATAKTLKITADLSGKNTGFEFANGTALYDVKPPNQFYTKPISGGRGHINLTVFWA